MPEQNLKNGRFSAKVEKVIRIVFYQMTNSYRPGDKKLAKSQSVIQPGKFHTSTGCPAPMFAESVSRVNTTNKLKQCGPWKVLQRDY